MKCVIKSPLGWPAKLAGKGYQGFPWQGFSPGTLVLWGFLILGWPEMTASGDRSAIFYPEWHGIDGTFRLVSEEARVPETKAPLPPEEGEPSPGEEEQDPHKRFDHLIFDVAGRYDVDPALVKAIIMAESGFNSTAVSKKGAMGLMQLMPRTAAALGIKDCFNPGNNIAGGVRYFKNLLDRLDGDIHLSLAAYNAGLTKVLRFKGVPPYKTTRYYIDNVMKYYRKYKAEIPQEVRTGRDFSQLKG